MGRQARLLFVAAGRARPDQLCPWAQTGLDREPPHSDAGDGGSRSRAAARYSSVASLHGAGALALTESKRATQFPEEPKMIRVEGGVGGTLQLTGRAWLRWRAEEGC